MSDQNSNGNGNDFSWIKPAVTPRPKRDLRKENPMLYFALKQQEQKHQKEEEEKKQKNDEIKKQAPKRLDTQVALINNYLLQLQQALQKEHQHLAIKWSFVKTTSISNLRSSYFDDIAGWDQHASGQHDFEGPVDIQDQPRAHGALYDTLYKTTVYKTCTIVLNNKEIWTIDVYPGRFDGSLAVATPTNFCSTIDEIKAKIQESIEKKLREAAG